MESCLVLQNSEARKTQTQSKACLDVLRKHLAIFGQHYRQPITELSIIAYAEDLADLTPDQLDAACIEARRIDGGIFRVEKKRIARVDLGEL